jgi:transmembrane sensor
VRAVGTSFTVRRLADDSVRVVVREGTVEVSQLRDARQPMRASANVAVTSRPTGDIASASLPPAELSRQLAWREGMLAFDGVPVAAAAEEFARYSDTRIVVEDPRLAAETVTGLFSANDPRGFAKAVALSFDARVTAVDDRLYLSR